MAPRLVTISASYGAGGSAIGPRVAERLGVPFVDRAIPASVARRLEIPLEEAVGREEVAHGTFSRWLVHFAPAVQLFGGAPMDPRPHPAGEEEFRLATEHALREHAAAGAVILGRAGAIVLRDAPDALHVRLDGPQERRVAQAARILGLDEATAAEELRLSDAARETYVRHWYRCDPRDPRLYHLMIDSTAIPQQTCVELIVLACTARA
jgi:cytidylate kinase